MTRYSTYSTGRIFLENDWCICKFRPVGRCLRSRIGIEWPRRRLSQLVVFGKMFLYNQWDICRETDWVMLVDRCRWVSRGWLHSDIDLNKNLMKEQTSLKIKTIGDSGGEWRHWRACRRACRRNCRGACRSACRRDEHSRSCGNRWSRDTGWWRKAETLSSTRWGLLDTRTRRGRAARG